MSTLSKTAKRDLALGRMADGLTAPENLREAASQAFVLGQAYENQKSVQTLKSRAKKILGVDVDPEPQHYKTGIRLLPEDQAGFEIDGLHFGLLTSKEDGRVLAVKRGECDACGLVLGYRIDSLADLGDFLGMPDGHLTRLWGAKCSVCRRIKDTAVPA